MDEGGCGPPLVVSGIVGRWQQADGGGGNGHIRFDLHINNVQQTLIQTTGTAGRITGDRYEALELQYMGGGVFNVLSASG
jgi:hypothetical protein